MALVKCPECGHEISDTVKQCPNCVYKIKGKKSINKKMVIIPIVIVLLICIVAIIKIVVNNGSPAKQAINIIKSDYGKNVAQNFAYNLAKNNINIVSGLARGIDSFSHIGAIKAKGITVGVLGNGLDMIYPKENIYLAQEILNSNGAIISECPLGTKPEKANFPKRNRIISGMCNGILVVEAKAKSGTIITIDFALEQGRDVFAIPGNINSENSYGTNEIIKQGAKLVTNWSEIVEEYGIYH